ncbi:peptidoglycan editing factor PgeF [Alkalicoccus daliensis]|uniref:Purine nucleoside phosphorylase n=1 Tax=Alkalicoccus daliensis TaxID=745820 RepID=A0A1H0I9W0_9BACI|nr:peptidoglycan editing factor PgeF [Alkalicoccus daliensis]SDO28178.1 conserved hypothetical protein [Alkalicoccus daliensis]
MTEPFSLNKNQLLLQRWENHIPGLRAGFTTRTGGTSEPPFHSNNMGLHVNDSPDAVIANREELAEQLGFPLSSWVAAEQTHEDQIVKVTAPLAGSGARSFEDTIKRTDGFYTKEKNLLLTLAFADCVPIYFLNEEKGLIGVAHAGWQGTVKNISGKMVKLWEEMEGVHPGTVFAAIGPSIDKCCYVVDEKVITALEEVLPNHKPYEELSPNQYALQLKEANLHLLINEGVPPENILVSDYCTSCEEELFFSHRRDQGKTGRMISFIGQK